MHHKFMHSRWFPPVCPVALLVGLVLLLLCGVEAHPALGEDVLL